ncbi:MAG: tetratricopeptide repeat protein [Bacteroidetes bacterium]|nr:tetratricopeptide repeat protein [Bacteroidota bacterium]
MKITLFIFGLLVSFIHVEAKVHPLFAAANRQYQEQQYDSALLLFNQLIQQYPDSHQGYFNRGLCLYKTEKYSEALLDLHDCLLLDSTFMLARFVEAMCWQHTGRWEQAMQSFGSITEPEATLLSTRQRIKNYHLSVYIATRWYYIIAMALIFILLIATVISLFSAAKNR